jgi:hypothetical protein
MKPTRIHPGRYRLGEYDIVQTERRVWTVVWGDDGSVRSGLEIGSFHTLAEAVDCVRNEIAHEHDGEDGERPVLKP